VRDGALRPVDLIAAIFRASFTSRSIAAPRAHLPTAITALSRRQVWPWPAGKEKKRRPYVTTARIVAPVQT